jgi:hypothetical protein
MKQNRERFGGLQWFRGSKEREGKGILLALRSVFIRLKSMRIFSVIRLLRRFMEKVSERKVEKK